jgi:hypothetical protein
MSCPLGWPAGGPARKNFYGPDLHRYKVVTESSGFSKVSCGTHLMRGSVQNFSGEPYKSPLACETHTGETIQVV